ncbi:hypothetical protein [Gemmatimonas sp.]|uniref:hypothetical protein n=1 Tax=Gemmatimonas sp. TaxID=1962908 RepID=UPI003F6FCEA8
MGDVLADLQLLSGKLLSFLVPLAAVGALAMAFVEAAKKLRDTRARHNARRFTVWMHRWARGNNAVPAMGDWIELAMAIPSTDAQRLATELTAATSGWGYLPPPEARAVFGMDTSQFVAILSESADIAMAQPLRYPALFELLADGSSVDARAWLQAASTNADTNDASYRAAGQALGRIRQQVKRRLDAFEAETGARWASLNQSWSNALGACLMALLLVRSQRSPGEVMILSVVGGILAPVAKDLVSALKSVGGAKG